VPADAKVFVNGKETTSTGSRREYVSYGLKPGYTYRYEVKAQVVRKQQPSDTSDILLENAPEVLMEETHYVTLTAGDNKGLAFSKLLPQTAVAAVP